MKTTGNKRYIQPNLDILNVGSADVITTSGFNAGEGYQEDFFVIDETALFAFGE